MFYSITVLMSYIDYLAEQEDVKLPGSVSIINEDDSEYQIEENLVTRKYREKPKLRYGNLIKQKAKKLLKEMTVGEVRNYFKQKIPYNTIRNWKDRLSESGSARREGTGKKKHYDKKKKEEVLQMLTTAPVSEVIEKFKDQVLKATIYNWASILRRKRNNSPS